MMNGSVYLGGEVEGPALLETSNIELPHPLQISPPVESNSERHSCAGKDNGKAAMSKIVEVWDRPGSEGGLGLGGIVLVLAVSYFTGINPLTLINMLNGVQDITESSAPSEPAPTGSPNDQLGKFAAIVLADTETTWRQLFGPRYEDPRLVLFTGAVQSACGTTSSAVGPFYCPRRSQSLSRPLLLQRDVAPPWCARRLRTGLCDCP